MTRRAVFAAGFVSALVLLAVTGFKGIHDRGDDAFVRVEIGPLTVWTTYPGRLESQEEVRIASRLDGAALLLELVPEGTAVQPDAVLARFDTAELDREILKLEEDFAIAEADLESTLHAQLPIESQALAAELVANRHELAREERFLEESRLLAEEDLISQHELAEQAERVTELRAKHEALESRLRLTNAYLHPAAVRRAEARYRAAAETLTLARLKKEASVIRAPTAGIVVHPPIHAGSEFRPARTGDRLFANQVFMTLPDFGKLIARCEIPEAELADIVAGSRVSVRPLAFPGLELAGTVAQVGHVAQTLAGQPVWQRYFSVRIALAQQDPRLKPGMSVTVNILAYHDPDALLVPRRAVTWEAGRATVRVAARHGDSTRDITVGRADPSHYQVLAGLKPGERVRLP